MSGPFGKLRDVLVMKMLKSSTKNGMKVWRELRAREGLPPWEGNLFDVHNDTSARMFMVGTPNMDFPREDWPEKLTFVGPLVSHKRSPSPSSGLSPELTAKIDAHRGRVVVIAQGTIDNRDPEKLFVPALTALSGTEYLVIATTGGLHKDELRRRFQHDNVVIENFIDYGALMPHVSLFISNGGYGSVMQALVNGVPLLLAGKLEGKNDINARLDYRRLGVDLRTERPTPKQIRRGVERVLSGSEYRENAKRLRDELASYDPFSIIEQSVVGGPSMAAQ
jgi:UDP:flavonoid glycosyltransferase YjiC (YdhE family)